MEVDESAAEEVEGDVRLGGFEGERGASGGGLQRGPSAAAVKSRRLTMP